MLLIVESIVSDSDVDLRDEYRDQAYAAWTEERLVPVAGLTEGRLHEPPGVGLALLLAAPYAIAGPVGAELLVAALLALGFVAAAALARRLVPDPWATGACIVSGLSPPALGWSTAIAPDPVAAAAIAIAAVFAMRVRAAPAPRRAVGAAIAIGALPWLSVKFLPAAIVLVAVLARWLRRRQRGLAAFVSLEVVLISGVFLLTVNGRLYKGFSPYVAVPGEATGADSASDYLERLGRFVTAFFDPDIGFLVWAPFGVLTFLSILLVVRLIRERVAVALPDVVHVEVSAALLVALCVGQGLVAVLLTPSLEEPAFPGRELIPVLPVAAALCSLALRHVPRAGGALALATLVPSAWLLIGGRFGGELAPPDGPLPWAGAEVVIAALVVVALGALLVDELRKERELS